MSAAICARCQRRWFGLAECHCATCHRHFGNVKAFDRHRRDDTCLDPATVTKRNGNPAFAPVERASGLVWLEWYANPRPWDKRPAATRSGVST